MIWFLLGAVVSVAAFDWSGGGGSRRFWLIMTAALAAFAFSLTLEFPAAGRDCIELAELSCRAGFLFFAALFLIATASFGAAALFRRLSAMSFVCLVLSDLALLSAVWAYHNETGSWALPPRQGWSGASWWGALAALLRLTAPLLASSAFNVFPTGQRHNTERSWHQITRRADTAPSGLMEAAVLAVGWWQGLFVAWWVGGQAGPILALGGLALWPAAAVFSKSRIGSLAAAGGLAAIGAGLAAKPAALAATGLAGVALALGAPLLGLWVMGVMPLSFVTTLELPSAFSSLSAEASWGAGGTELMFWLGWAVLFPVAWSVAVPHLERRPRPGSDEDRLPVRRSGALLAAAATVIAAVTGSGGRQWLVWVLAGAGVAALAVLRVSGKRSAIFFRDEESADVLAAAKAVQTSLQGPGGESDETGVDEEQPPGASARISSEAWTMALGRTAPGWALFCLALVLFAGLVFSGLKTGFL